MENKKGDLSTSLQKGGSSSCGQIEAAKQDDRSNWAMEVYIERKEEDLLREAEEEILELDLGEDEEASQQHLAMVVYYSRKSYNPKVLMVEMLNAWGIQKLVLAEKVGNYLFKLEFRREEEKRRALEGGPWRHKGDAFILTHYDGLAQPLEIRITTIALWIRFYDLPHAMMKEGFTKQSGGLLGLHYPGYMWVRVEYPLHKALTPELKVKIRGWGLMPIIIRYENVPYFCFTCGRIGHAAANYEQGDAEEQEIKYGEELRASRDITVRQLDTRVAKPLFQTLLQASSNASGSRDNPRWTDDQKAKECIADNSGHEQEGLVQGGDHLVQNIEQHDNIDKKPDTESKDMQLDQETWEAGTHDKGGGFKERVSLRTNMTTDEESSDGNSVIKIKLELATAVERFHVRKFGAKLEKRSALKVHGMRVSKKQKTPH
jgi:hypothetical protein